MIALWIGATTCALADTTNSVRESQFLSNVRQLIFEGRRSGEGYFSPDGKGLIFQSERDPENPFYQIYILNFDSGDIRRVSPGVGKMTCAFFRPGRDEVFFASTHLDPQAVAKQKAELEFRASGKQRRYSWDYDEHMDIFSARRDGSRPRRLTSAPGYDAEGAYSPDGRKIVFCSVRDAYPTNKLSESDRKRFEADPAFFGELYIMNADGTGQKRLTQTPGYDGGPFFSPDGRQIVFRGRALSPGPELNDYMALLRDGLWRPTSLEIFVMNADGSGLRQVTSLGGASFAPFFSPDGKKIIFSSNQHNPRGRDFELWLVNVDGTGLERVTWNASFDGFPMFSPDGKKLVFASNRFQKVSGETNVFIADWSW